jgi:hypothetical protein
MQERVREKLRTYKDYDDFLKNFERHRFKHEHRAHVLREEGWKELSDKHGAPSEFNLHPLKMDKKYDYKYNSYNDLGRYYDGYWDTKANHLYYS